MKGFARVLVIGLKGIDGLPGKKRSSKPPVFAESWVSAYGVSALWTCGAQGEPRASLETTLHDVGARWRASPGLGTATARVTTRPPWRWQKSPCFSPRQPPATSLPFDLNPRAFRLPGMVTTEMKHEWVSINVRHLVFGVVFLDFAATYLAVRTNATVASFHVRINHHRQSTLPQMLADHCFKLMCRNVGTILHSGCLRLVLPVPDYPKQAHMHIRSLLQLIRMCRTVVVSNCERMLLQADAFASVATR